jgi:hypothetical protein
MRSNDVERRVRLVVLANLCACGDGPGVAAEGRSTGEATTEASGSSSVPTSGSTSTDGGENDDPIGDVPDVSMDVRPPITEPKIELCGTLAPHPPPDYGIYADRYGDVWGFVSGGREYAALGHTFGLSIVDVTDDPIVEVGHLELPGYVPGRAVRGKGHTVYVGGQGPMGSLAYLRIVDVSDPTAPVLLEERPEYADRIHTLQVFGDVLYLNSGFGMCRFLTLDDPTDPVEVGSYLGNDCHDVLAVGNRLFVAGGFTERWDIVDISDLTSPSVLGVTAPERGVYAHSGALDETGTWYFAFDEFHVHDVLIYDVSDPAIPTLHGTFGIGPEIPHEGIRRGNYLYTAWYEAGFVLVDVHEPTAPFEALRHPTWPHPPETAFDGAIALDLNLPSGKVLVSDTLTGLWVLCIETPP